MNYYVQCSIKSWKYNRYDIFVHMLQMLERGSTISFGKQQYDSLHSSLAKIGVRFNRVKQRYDLSSIDSRKDTVRLYFDFDKKTISVICINAKNTNTKKPIQV